MTMHTEAILTDWEQFTAAHSPLAFQRLYERYYHYFALVGARRGASIETTRDVTNDLFAYLWESHARLGTIVSPHNYLVTIFLQKLRHLQATAATPADMTMLESLAAPISEPSVESIYIQNQSQDEQRILLASFLEKLPARQREVLYQKFYLGLSNIDIAQAGNVSVSTVYNTIQQALEKLRGLLGDKAFYLLGLTVLLLALLGRLM